MWMDESFDSDFRRSYKIDPQLEPSYRAHVLSPHSHQLNVMWGLIHLLSNVPPRRATCIPYI